MSGKRSLYVCAICSQPSRGLVCDVCRHEAMNHLMTVRMLRILRAIGGLSPIRVKVSR